MVDNRWFRGMPIRRAAITLFSMLRCFITELRAKAVARGGRANEAYYNTFTGTGINKFIGGIRSGVALFHDNNISGLLGQLGHLRFKQSALASIVSRSGLARTGQTYGT